jgi:hypothetical protein
MEKFEGLQSLYYVQNKSQMNQFRLVMVIVALFVGYVAYYYKAPILFCLAFGGFFLLPAILIGNLSKDAKKATEAYEGGIKKSAVAAWEASSWDDSTTWEAWLQVEGHDKKYYVEVGRGADNMSDFFKCDEMNKTETDVVVWLHPKTNEPHLMMYQDKIFLLKPSIPKWATY